LPKRGTNAKMKKLKSKMLNMVNRSAGDKLQGIKGVRHAMGGD